MSAFRMVKTVAFLAVAASRNPTVRAAVKAAPGMLTDERKRAALEATRHAARKAGQLTARILPPNRYF